MNDLHEIREKALRMAVRTGNAPDLDFVWDWQRQNSYETCYGFFDESCPMTCRWYERCKALTMEPIEDPWPTNPPVQEEDS